MPHSGIDEVPADTAAVGLSKHTEYSNLLWVLFGLGSGLREGSIMGPCYEVWD